MDVETLSAIEAAVEVVVAVTGCGDAAAAARVQSLGLQRQNQLADWYGELVAELPNTSRALRPLRDHPLEEPRRGELLARLNQIVEG